MPYGAFKDDKHFQIGLALQPSKEFSSVYAFLSHISEIYKDNPELVILGNAARRIREGMILEGRLILQESGIEISEEARKMLNNVHKLGEEKQKLTIDYAVREDPFTDEFLKKIGIKPTY